MFWIDVDHGTLALYIQHNLMRVNLKSSLGKLGS